MRIHPAFRALDERWRQEWNLRRDLDNVRTAMRAVVAKVGDLSDTREALASPGHLTEKGIADGVREAAVRGKAVAWLRIARWEAEKLLNRAAAQKQELLTPKIDKTDIAAALFRGEMRSFLRSLQNGERVGLLSKHPELLEAALEGPAALSGMSDEQMADISSRFIEDGNRPEFQNIHQLEEIASLVETMAGVAAKELQKVTALDEGKPFDTWLSTVTAPVEAAIESERLGGDRVMNILDRL